jgi:hypothetical protein
MNYNEWIDVGVEEGWCGPAVCYTHDGLPTSMKEDVVNDLDGEYPCIHIIRLYESIEQKLEIEENHSPSNWRKNGS